MQTVNVSKNMIYCKDTFPREWDLLVYQVTGIKMFFKLQINFLVICDGKMLRY